MQNTPIVLSQIETISLLKIANLSEMELSAKQWELLGRLTGSILTQLRECFMDCHTADAISITLSPAKELFSTDELCKQVPFFSHRI